MGQIVQTGQEGKIRVSKLLADQGLCSRREADHYIEQGLVLLDGEVVSQLGTRAYPHQKVELATGAKQQQATRLTFILNKPIGFISVSYTHLTLPTNREV